MNHCKHCGVIFTPSRKNQKYCLNSTCRRERKRKWQRNKIKTDSDYNLAQKEAQAQWRSKHPEYWREYRSQHPQTTERNRQLQRERNKKRSRKYLPSPAVIAKMDVKPSYFSGTYFLFPVTEASPDLIAKMDAKLVCIQPVMEDEEKK